MKTSLLSLIMSITFICNGMEQEGLNNALIKACGSEGDDSKVAQLLEKKASVNALGIMQRTPLHYAAGQDNLATVKLLIESKSFIEALDIHGNTPLLISGFHRQARVMKYLINNKANIYAQSKAIKAAPINHAINPRIEGATALFFAVQHNNSDCVELLLKKGVLVHNYLEMSEDMAPLLRLMLIKTRFHQQHEIPKITNLLRLFSEFDFNLPID